MNFTEQFDLGDGTLLDAAPLDESDGSIDINLELELGEDGDEYDYDLEDGDDGGEHASLLGLPDIKTVSADHISSVKVPHSVRIRSDSSGSATHVKNVAESWVRLLTATNYLLIILSLCQLVLGLAVGSQQILILNSASYLLVIFGMITAALSIMGVLGLRLRQSDPRVSESSLSTYVNLGVVLLILFLAFCITLLSMGDLFWNYVKLHWLDEYQDVFRGLPIHAAIIQTKGTVTAMATLSLCSAALLALNIVGCSLIKPPPLVDDQSFLWSTLLKGVSGCVLLATSTYAGYHEASVPLSPSETMFIHGCGMTLFLAAIFAMYREYHWQASFGKKTHKSIFTWLHMTILGAVAVGLVILGLQTLWHSYFVQHFLDERGIYTRFGLKSVDREDSTDKLLVSTEMKLQILAVGELLAALFATAAIWFAYNLDNILIRKRFDLIKETQEIDWDEEDV